MNGMPIQNKFTDVIGDFYFLEAVTKRDWIAKPKRTTNAIIVSDASNFKISCKWLEGDVTDIKFFTLTLEEGLLSSGEQELLALLEYFQHLSCTNSQSINGINFIWATDSQNLVAFLQKGSPKWYIQLKVFEVYRPCKELNRSIEPLHLLRTDERIQ